MNALFDSCTLSVSLTREISVASGRCYTFWTCIEVAPDPATTRAKGAKVGIVAF